MTATDLVVEFMPGAGPFDIPGSYYLVTTGTGGSRASTPDHASLDIVGDIDVRIDLAADQWVPNLGLNFELIGKQLLTGNQRSWVLYLRPDRKVAFRWSTDGTAEFDIVSTTIITPIPGERLALRVTLDVDNGAAGRTATFYTSDTISGTWAQLGDPVTQSGTTSIFASTATLDIGDIPTSGFEPLEGRVYAAQVRDGIAGTVVANPDFSAQTPGTTSFADSTGKTWTLTSSTIVGFDWEEIPNCLLDASWSYGRNDPLSRFGPGDAKLVFANENRSLDPEHTAGTWYGKLLPRVPVRVLSVASALDLPGSVGATATTPDRSTFAVTDLDVRMHLAADDWTPGGFGQNPTGQWGSSGNQAWIMGLTTTGLLNLTWTANGSTGITRTSTVATGFVDGSDHWIRVTLDVDNGAAGHDVRFYTSADGVTWTQLGATVTTAGTTSIFNSTAPLAIADVLSFTGQVRYLEVRNGIAGTVVANPEFVSQDPGTTSFKDRAGNTWTVNGTAVIALDTVLRSDEFYGFVQDGWIPDYQPPATATVTVPLTDMLGVLAGEKLPDSVYSNEILTDRPVAHWRFDEQAGTQMADSSGNGNHGFIDNGELGVEGLIVDGQAFSAPHVGDNRGRFTGEALPTGPPCTLEAWVKTARDLTFEKEIIVVQRDNAFGSGVVLGIETSGDGSPNGELVINFAGLGTFYKARGNQRIDDNTPHHVVCTIATTTAADVLLYVDGVAQTKTTISGTNGGSWASHHLWTLANSADTGQGDFGLDGVIDEVAIYDLALTPERVLAHYEAGATGFDSDFSGTRVGRVLDTVGVPSTLRDIGVGDTTVGPANYTGQSALDYLTNVVESEQGYLYVAHWNGGKVTFRGRYSRLTEDRSTAVLWAFSDDDDIGAMHYERAGLDIASNGIDSIVNLVECRWKGGTVTPRDEASIQAFGPQFRTITTEAPTASTAESAGLWLINQYSQPQSRVQGFTLRPDADTRLRHAAMDLRISDRFSLERHPLNVGSSVTTELYVERVGHSFTRGIGHTTTIRCSDAFLGDVWIWGVSEWDVDTVWG